jgi:hypothetical protein
MSPYHLSLMIKGHKESKVDNYKLVRLLMFTMVRLMGDPKSSPKSPEQLWELPGDEDLNKINEDEYRELIKRLAK